MRNLRTVILCSIAVTVAFLSGSATYAQDISGDWQGTLKVNPALRCVVHITKGDNGGWSALMYSIDQGPDGMTVSSITLNRSDFKFSVDSINGSYEGKLSLNGSSITGIWSQNGERHELILQRATQETLWKHDQSPHSISFVTVDKGVKLEVLDWGGSGRALVLLAGLGFTAHLFDHFAPKLTATFHVYGITRRGFGDSSVPAAVNGNYSADRLGDDVLAVMDSLKLNRPVLVGHSIGGEELSSIGSRHPEKVAGLIYLDAGYSYAFYDRTRGDLQLDSIDLSKKLAQIPVLGPPDAERSIQELLQTGLPQLEVDLRKQLEELQALPAEMQVSPPQGGIPIAIPAIIAGEQKYTNIPVPILAIFAVPQDLGVSFKDGPAARAKWEASDTAIRGAEVNAFEKGLPSAHVVRFPNARHLVFQSNEADVLREMSIFLAGLK
jgi:pimeloyl-ACP methyl ester carboxylesterase